MNKNISILAIATIVITTIGLAVIPSLEEQQANADRIGDTKQKVKDKIKEVKKKIKDRLGNGGGGCDSCG